MSHLSHDASFDARFLPHRVLLRRPVLALIGISLLLGICFLSLGSEVREHETLATDQSLLRTIDNHTTTIPVTIANDVSLPGAEPVVGGIGVLLIGLFLLRRRWSNALFIAATVGGYAVLTFLLKQIVQRERPVAFFRVPESGYSFPSGHTLGATCLAIAIGYFLWQSRQGIGVKVVGTVMLVLVTLLVGGSRLVLGVHYPTDVLGSIVLGSAWMSALLALRDSSEHWQGLRKRDRGSLFAHRETA